MPKLCCMCSTEIGEQFSYCVVHGAEVAILLGEEEE